MQTPEVAMDNVIRFVKENDPARCPSFEEVYRQIRNSRARRGRGTRFGVVTGSFPVEPAKGKKIRGCLLGCVLSSPATVAEPFDMEKSSIEC